MYTLGPSGDTYPPFNGFREYWQRSYSGKYLPEYEAGVTLGKADLENGDEANLRALILESGTSDVAWEARANGYNDATRAARGSNAISNGM